MLTLRKLTFFNYSDFEDLGAELFYKSKVLLFHVNKTYRVSVYPLELPELLG